MYNTHTYTHAHTHTHMPYMPYPLYAYTYTCTWKRTHGRPSSLAHGFRLAHCSFRFRGQKKVAQIEIYWTVWKASSFLLLCRVLPFLRPPSSSRSLLLSICTFSVLFSDHPSFLRHSLSLSLFLFPSASLSGPSFSSRTRDFKFVGGCRKIHRESRLTSPGDQRNVKSVRTKFHRRFVSLGTGFKAREISVDKVKKFVLYTVKYAASIGRYVANFTFLLVVRSSWKNVCSVWRRLSN